MESIELTPETYAVFNERVSQSVVGTGAPARRPRPRTGFGPSRKFADGFAQSIRQGNLNYSLRKPHSLAIHYLYINFARGPLLARISTLDRIPSATSQSDAAHSPTRCRARSNSAPAHLFRPKLDMCKVWPHGQHPGQDHRDHRRCPRHRLRNRQGPACAWRAGGHRRPRRRAWRVGRRRSDQARAGLGLSPRRHRSGILRDVPRQGTHRRRWPHRRTDQQRRRDADRPVPRTVRAVDPFVDRGESCTA